MSDNSTSQDSAQRRAQPGVAAVSTCSSPTFRAGDVVKHGPTGETWTLANDEENGSVSPCGWPRCWADAADCSLVKAATDVQRVEMLTRWAAKTLEETDGYDHRVSTAKEQLSANAGDVARPAAGEQSP